MAETLHKVQGKLYKSFGFIVGYGCNFRCPYCFENEISNHGKSWSMDTFSEKMVDEAFDAMLKIEDRRELHNKEILLFGGEPLLEGNENIVKYIVDKGVDLGYKFKVITNGYNVDLYKDFLNSNKFTLFQMTLDGDRVYHNMRRFHYLKGDSFDKIIANIKLLLDKNINVIVKVNTDKNNIRDFEHLKSMFEELGYIKNPCFELRSSFLREFEFNSNNAGCVDYLPSVECLNEKVLNEFNGEIQCDDYGIYNQFYSNLKNKTRCRLHPASCSSQYGSYLFDPMGNIYTCLEIVGKTEFVIGTYSDNELKWNEVREHWFRKHVGNSIGCKKCKYALLCGGPCTVRISHTKEGFNHYYCNQYKKIFPMSVNRAYRDFKNNK